MKNPLLRGIIGGFSCGAPRPSGAGCTRQPEGCFCGGFELSAGESAARSPNVLLPVTEQMRGERPDSNRRPPGPQPMTGGSAHLGFGLLVRLTRSELTALLLS